jgi:chemotaxis protein MotB
MKRMSLMLVGLAAMLSAAACSNKELIRQKDLTIAELRADSTRLENDVATERRMNEELRSRLAALEQEHHVLIEERDGLTHITLDGSATFGTAQADLTAEGKAALDQVWGVVQNYPDRWLLIEGHADDRPIRPGYRHVFASNWELSSARAHSVLHYLVNQLGAAPDRLAAVGYGDRHPVADNTTSEGRAQNRRVVITIGSKLEVKSRMEQGDVSRIDP